MCGYNINDFMRRKQTFSFWTAHFAPLNCTKLVGICPAGLWNTLSPDVRSSLL